MNYKRSGFIGIVILYLATAITAGAKDKIISESITALRSKNLQRKLLAIQHLAKSRDRIAIAELRAELKQTKDKQVKAAIIEAFSYCHNADTTREAIDILKTDKDYEARYAAAYSLGYARDPAVVPVLIETFLNESEPLGIRLQAANALTNYPVSEEVFQCFVRGLEDKNINVKAQSIVSLAMSFGRIEPERVIPILKKFTADQNELVSKTAKQYLEFLGVK